MQGFILLPFRPLLGISGDRNVHEVTKDELKSPDGCAVSKQASILLFSSLKIVHKESYFQ